MNNTCKYCGAPIQSGMKNCPSCGSPIEQQPMQGQYNQPANQTPVTQGTQADSGSIGWAILGFFIPLVGIILYFVWKATKPKSANMAGIGALIGMVLNIILYSTGVVKL